MKVYLVGGAVRDALLGRAVTERDWVVVGATARALLKDGYRQVGKGFPVFLHPTTGEEYALARTERKSGHGYHGFELTTNPKVSIEDDLRRRDLTINAMARDEDENLIDPFHGAEDLAKRVLRHVSSAFAEDPVRVLRVARFAARYAELGFRVAPETMALMEQMTEAGEVDHLVPERIWGETLRALEEPSPDRFIEVLRECGALARIYPEIDRLFGVPQPEADHPEVDCGAHLLRSLEQAVRLGASAKARFAVLVHDLGKGTTPAESLPEHPGYEQRGAELVEALAARLRIPNEFRKLGRAVALHHNESHRALELGPDEILAILEALGAITDCNRLEDFLKACEADARGRRGLENRPYPQSELLRQACAAAAAVKAAPFVAEGLQGPAVGEAIREERLRRIATVGTGYVLK